MSHLHTKMWKQTPEEWKLSSLLAHTDKAISEVNRRFLFVYKIKQKYAKPKYTPQLKTNNSFFSFYNLIFVIS